MQVKQKRLVTWEGAVVIAVVLVMVTLVGGPLVVLAVENIATLMIEVPLTVFGWHTPLLPLGVVLLLSCLLGALLLYLVAVVSAWRDRRVLAQLRKRVVELEQAQGAPPAQRSSPLQTGPLPAMQANPSPKPFVPSASR
jgi:uncharacterized integral membrane protein